VTMKGVGRAIGKEEWEWESVRKDAAWSMVAWLSFLESYDKFKRHVWRRPRQHMSRVRYGSSVRMSSRRT
jgi:hypothetical protein